MEWATSEAGGDISGTEDGPTAPPDMHANAEEGTVGAEHGVAEDAKAEAADAVDRDELAKTGAGRQLDYKPPTVGDQAVRCEMR